MDIIVLSEKQDLENIFILAATIDFIHVEFDKNVCSVNGIHININNIGIQININMSE